MPVRSEFGTTSRPATSFPLRSANQDPGRVEPRRAIRRRPPIVRIPLSRQLSLTLAVDRRIRPHRLYQFMPPPLWRLCRDGQTPFDEFQFSNRHVVISVLRNRRSCPAKGDNQANRPQAQRHGRSSLFMASVGRYDAGSKFSIESPWTNCPGRCRGREYNAPAETVNDARGERAE